jgi:hypothetical protein
MSHGIPEEEASKLIVNGFIEPIIKELPMSGELPCSWQFRRIFGSMPTRTQMGVLSVVAGPAAKDSQPKPECHQRCF